jgi:hypothetical protein
MGWSQAAVTKMAAVMAEAMRAAMAAVRATALGDNSGNCGGNGDSNGCSAFGVNGGVYGIGNAATKSMKTTTTT